MKTSHARAAATFAVGVALCFGVAGCAPQEAANGEPADSAESAKAVDGASSAPALPTSWSPESDCNACHAKKAQSTSSAGCLAGDHSSKQGFECVTCHADAAGLEKAHGDMTGKMPTKLKKTKVEQGLCESCHTDEEFAAVAAGDVTLIDEEGTAVNPHALPDTPSHADVACIQCHTAHEGEGYIESAQEYCVSCHHENVFACGTCHG